MTGRGKRWKVLVLGSVRAEGLDLLRDIADLTVLPEPTARTDILACIGDVDAVLHKTGRIDAESMARQTKLRIIARHGVGLDELDLDSIPAAGVPVSTTPGANSNAVAEATVGLTLSVLRHLPRGEAMIKRDRAWKRGKSDGARTRARRRRDRRLRTHRSAGRPLLRGLRRPGHRHRHGPRRGGRQSLPGSRSRRAASHLGRSLAALPADGGDQAPHRPQTASGSSSRMR